MDFLTFSHEYTVEGYVTFLVHVTSGLFSGESSFCIAAEALKKGVHELQSIYKLLIGEFTLHDYDSDDFIAFEMQKYGHIVIRGQVGGSHSSQYLVYKFHSDQAGLKQIIDDLNCLL